MGPFLTLVKIFLLQLIRSKALWMVSGLLLAMLLLNVYYQSQFEEFMEEGKTYEIATKEVSGRLKDIAVQLKSYAVYFVMVIAALVAPASRKNGTTQFVLTMQVSRLQSALSQFTALSIFIGASVLVTHLGFCIAALRVDFLGFPELLLSWISFLLPLLSIAAVSFSISLVCSPVAVYLILFGIPFLLLPLLDSLMTWKGEWVPVAIARLIDNIGFLFPEAGSFIFWPYLSPNMMISDPPYPVWTWSVLNFVFATVFWILAGYFFFHKLNIGSRQMLK